MRQSISDDDLTAQEQQPLSLSSRRILRSLASGMDELEINARNVAVKPNHAHMYLHLVQEQQLHDLVSPHR